MKFYSWPLQYLLIRLSKVNSLQAFSFAKWKDMGCHRMECGLQWKLFLGPITCRFHEICKNCKHTLKKIHLLKALAESGYGVLLLSMMSIVWAPAAVSTCWWEQNGRIIACRESGAQYVKIVASSALETSASCWNKHSHWIILNWYRYKPL